MKRYLVPTILIMAALLLSSCGYNFRGKQNSLPPDVRSIAIPVFKNNTSQERIESTFTDEVIFQFTRSQMVQLTDPGRADAVLSGTIKSISTSDVAYTADETSRQQRVTIKVSAKLVRRRDGKVLWQDKSLSQRRTYDVTDNAQANESAKVEAITELAGEMAQTLHDRVFENF